MESNRLKIVISDFHLSRGKWLPNGKRNPLEDFHQDDHFKDLLEFYSTGKYADTEVELIVNGDFFDPLAVIPIPDLNQKFPNLEYPLEVVEDEAVKKFLLILEGHPKTFSAMNAFLNRKKTIIFRWGNHDAALLWPAVQALIRTHLVAPQPDQLQFQQKPYVFDRICIDHGHQYEVLNQFDEANMFLERQTKDGIKRIQNLPFGSFFVLGFLNRTKFKRRYINYVQPLRVYMRISMFIDPVFFIKQSLSVIWFFIKMRLIKHPMRFARLKKTFLLIVEIFHRSSLEQIAEKIFTSSSAGDLPYDTLIMGHNHQATIRMFPGGKQYINTGTWIPITSLDMSTLGHQVRRTYALIEYPDGKARATLKVWRGNFHAAEDFI